MCPTLVAIRGSPLFEAAPEGTVIASTAKAIKTAVWAAANAAAQDDAAPLVGPVAAAVGEALLPMTPEQRNAGLHRAWLAMGANAGPNSQWDLLTVRQKVAMVVALATLPSNPLGAAASVRGLPPVDDLAGFVPAVVPPAPVGAVGAGAHALAQGNAAPPAAGAGAGAQQAVAAPPVAQHGVGAGAGIAPAAPRAAGAAGAGAGHQGAEGAVVGAGGEAPRCANPPCGFAFELGRAPPCGFCMRCCTEGADRGCRYQAHVAVRRLQPGGPPARQMAVDRASESGGSSSSDTDDDAAGSSSSGDAEDDRIPHADRKILELLRDEARARAITAEKALLHDPHRQSVVYTNELKKLPAAELARLPIKRFVGIPELWTKFVDATGDDAADRSARLLEAIKKDVLPPKAGGDARHERKLLLDLVEEWVQPSAAKREAGIREVILRHIRAYTIAVHASPAAAKEYMEGALTKGQDPIVSLYVARETKKKHKSSSKGKGEAGRSDRRQRSRRRDRGRGRGSGPKGPKQSSGSGGGGRGGNGKSPRKKGSGGSRNKQPAKPGGRS